MPSSLRRRDPVRAAAPPPTLNHNPKEGTEPGLPPPGQTLRSGGRCRNTHPFIVVVELPPLILNGGNSVCATRSLAPVPRLPWRGAIVRQIICEIRSGIYGDFWYCPATLLTLRQVRGTQGEIGRSQLHAQGLRTGRNGHGGKWRRHCSGTLFRPPAALRPAHAAAMLSAIEINVLLLHRSESNRWIHRHDAAPCHARS